MQEIGSEGTKEKPIKKIRINTQDLEKLAVLIGMILKPIDFSKKFQIIVEYNPELQKSEIQYIEITEE